MTTDKKKRSEYRGRKTENRWQNDWFDPNFLLFLTFLVCPLSSGRCPQSSVICLLFSVRCHLSSVICPLSSVFCHPSSVFCHPSSVFCSLSSAFRRESMTASCSIGLKALIASLSRVGWTRLVSRTTIMDRSRSIQKDVPVKPRWPTLLREKNWPELEPLKLGVSKPRALSLPANGRKNNWTISGWNNGIEGRPW